METLRLPVAVLATWFGCGKSPRAPGTIGSLGALPLVWAYSLLTPVQYMAATLIFSVFAIFVAHLHELFSEKHDASEVVIDEVAGMLVTMAWIPFNWMTVLAGFLVFRFFDVLKPFPISYVDKKVGGGVGCVGDDLIAGIFASVVMQFLTQRGYL